MKTSGRPSSVYQAQARRGLANGQLRMRVVPCGESSVAPLIVASQVQGARSYQSGRTVPGSVGMQTGAALREYRMS